MNPRSMVVELDGSKVFGRSGTYGLQREQLYTVGGDLGASSCSHTSRSSCTLTTLEELDTHGLDVNGARQRRARTTGHDRNGSAKGGTFHGAMDEW